MTQNSNTMEEILAYPFFKEEETDKKLELLSFLDNCLKHGYDKLLEKYDLMFPKLSVTDSLEDIEGAITGFKNNMDYIREEEAFLKFSEAIKTILNGDKVPDEQSSDSNTPKVIPQAYTAGTYTKINLSFIILNEYLFDSEQRSPSQTKRSERLYRACKEGLMGDYGKAMISANNSILEMKKKNEELKAQNELLKKRLEEAAKASVSAKVSELSDLYRETAGLHSRDYGTDLLMRRLIDRDVDMGRIYTERNNRDRYANKFRTGSHSELWP